KRCNLEMVQLPIDILAKIAEYICGDTDYPFPYRKGRKLSLFFGSVGLHYSHDGSTRKWWTLEVLKQINTETEGCLPSKELSRVIEYLVAPHNSDSFECLSDEDDISLGTLESSLIMLLSIKYFPTILAVSISYCSVFNKS
ncbi:unnamed protein product, partial [marine sediment metagenome]